MRKSFVSFLFGSGVSMALAFTPPAIADTPGTVPTSASPTQGPDMGISGVGTGLSQFYTTTGKIFVSVDAAGSNDASHSVEVEKPNGAAKVLKAFLLAASHPWDYPYGTHIIGDGDVTLGGKPVSWRAGYLNPFPGFSYSWHSVLADVTAIVRPVVNAAGAGRVPFKITEVNTASVDGEILVVVFKDAAQPRKQTISLQFGGLKPTGDYFLISLSKPINPQNPKVLSDMGLGISYSYQATGDQYSIVDVNGQRLSTSSGGYDDGAAVNGGLMTVGGLDDSNANPADPYQLPPNMETYDDELYSLLPFMKKGDTEVRVSTRNPSGDDNVFFAYLLLHGEAEVNKDTDGDALLDDWEKNGYDADGDGVVDVDLPAMGANYRHKDIFVEVDWMSDASHSHKPTPKAIKDVVNAFRNAPVSNPDGKRGITLHVDTGKLGGGNSVAHDPDLKPVWTEFDAIKNANFDPKRARIFHYCVFGHNYESTTSSGLSRGIPASDFLVTLGSWDNGVGTRKQQAGTFMHELGHNLGLRHGGNDHVNYKPNFLSIMSYFFQMDWLRYKNKDGKLDYSRFSLHQLDEDDLNESRGLDVRGGNDKAIRNYGTRYFDPAGTQRVVNQSRRRVDWDRDGNPRERSVSVDLNNDGGLTVLTGQSNEWKNIVFNGGSIGAGEELPKLNNLVFPELTLEEYEEMKSTSVILD